MTQGTGTPRTGTNELIGIIMRLLDLPPHLLEWAERHIRRDLDLLHDGRLHLVDEWDIPTR